MQLVTPLRSGGWVRAHRTQRSRLPGAVGANGCIVGQMISGVRPSATSGRAAAAQAAIPPATFTASQPLAFR